MSSFDMISLFSSFDKLNTRQNFLIKIFAAFQLTSKKIAQWTKDSSKHLKNSPNREFKFHIILRIA